MGWWAAAIGTAAAGPWVHAPGTWYAEVSVATFRAGPAGGAPMVHRAQAASAYAEVGLVDGVELIADLPYTWASNRFPGSALRYRDDGFGAARVGLGVTHPRWTLPVSVQVLARVPLYGAGGRLPLDPHPGEPQADVDGIAAIGASPTMGEVRLWGLAEVGVRVRTGLVWAQDAEGARSSEAVRYHLQVGWIAGERGWVDLDAAGLRDLVGPGEVHQFGVGAAVAAAGEWHVTATVSAQAVAVGQPTGWGARVGLAHVRRVSR